MRHPRRRTLAAVPALIAVLLPGSLAACSDPVDTSPPSDPACVKALAALPGTVLGEERLAEASNDGAPVHAGWGDPAITLACGFDPVEPTTDACITVNGVDWVFRQEANGDLSFRSYGTAPSMEVVVPESYGRENATGALVDLAGAARALPKNGRACVG